MAALYEITKQIEYLEGLFTHEDEEAADLNESEIQALTQWLEDVDDARLEKLDGYAYYVKQLESELAICQEEYRAWRLKAERRTSQIGRLKSTLMEHFEAVGTPKVNTGKFQFSICKNGGHQPIRIDDPEDLPVAYQIQPPPVANSQKVRDALSAGEVVPGAELLERGKHIRIK